MVEIIDNFLGQEDFDSLQQFMMGLSAFPWFYSDRIDFYDDAGKLGNFQFVHTFYDKPGPTTFYNEMDSIINIIQPFSISRIKANLLTRTSEIVENSFHVDIEKMKIFKHKGRLIKWKTSILYLNTNNGYTEFKDGTIVESVANRFITFPATTLHRGTSCTDQNIRVIINFNYFAYEHNLDFVADDRT